MIWADRNLNIRERVTLQDLTQDGQYSNSEYNLSGVQLTVNKSSQALNVSLS
jgi:hypothetical protein